MKRVNIILVALSLLIAGQLWAQQDRRHSMSERPRRAWSTFEGDTVRYLEFNYTIRSRQYIGWTVGELLDELELPVIGIVNWETRISGGEPPPLAGLTFGIHQKNDVHHSELRDYYITVRFENPPLLEGFWRGSISITPEVKDLIISEVSANPFIIRDPELVERQRQLNIEAERQHRETRDFLDRLDRAESAEERERLIDEDRPRIEARMASERLRQAEWDAERRQLIEQQRQRRQERERLEREQLEERERRQNRN